MTPEDYPCQATELVDILFPSFVYPNVEDKTRDYHVLDNHGWPLDSLFLLELGIDDEGIIPPGSVQSRIANIYRFPDSPTKLIEAYSWNDFDLAKHIPELFDCLTVMWGDDLTSRLKIKKIIRHSSDRKTDRPVIETEEIDSNFSRLIENNFYHHQEKRFQKQNRQTYDSLRELLIDTIGPEIAKSDSKLIDFISNVETSLRQHSHKTYKISGIDGKQYFIKIHSDEIRADIEAAANYYLSQDLSNLIIPGLEPKAMKCANYYVTVQELKNEGPISPPPRYWISAIALFHRSAGKILRENGIIIPDFKIGSPDIYLDRIDPVRRELGVKIDKEKLSAAIDYVKYQSKHLVLLHGELKSTNRLGRYMVDHERLMYGDLRWDIAPLLIENPRFFPKESWGKVIDLYFYESGFDQKQIGKREKQELISGLDHFTYLFAARELISASIRERENKILENHSNDYRKFLSQ